MTDPRDRLADTYISHTTWHSFFSIGFWKTCSVHICLCFWPFFWPLSLLPPIFIKSWTVRVTSPFCTWGTRLVTNGSSYKFTSQLQREILELRTRDSAKSFIQTRIKIQMQKGNSLKLRVVSPRESVNFACANDYDFLVAYEVLSDPTVSFVFALYIII